MTGQPHILTIIPARGGSKRIPRKNIKLFAGQPMIAWPLQALQSYNCNATVLVSTDDDQIAEIATLHGAIAPFRRPANLSDDHATTAAVVEHALDWYEAQTDRQVDIVLVVYPTAVFLNTSIIAATLNKFSDLNVDMVFPVIEFPYPIQRGLRIDKEGHAQMLYPEHATTRSQDLGAVYHDAGQFYAQSAKAIRAKNISLNGANAVVPISRFAAVDIDTMDDFLVAEQLFISKQKNL